MTPRDLRRSNLAFGADYNPEQWAREVWETDVRLMRDAGVNLVSLGIFSWGVLEPEEGRYEFGWLDEVMELLTSHGIQIDLATATASTPAWMAHTYPEILPVDREGRRLGFGSRQAWCPSSVIFRDKAAALAETMATRYGVHPGVVLWHVGNESGCHNAHCYCERSADAFRAWLHARYDSVDDLNTAWSTSFWSQHYSSFAHVDVPRQAPTFTNPSQVVDFRRFCSDALLECFVAERDILHRLSPGTPVTTNFMVMDHFEELDYWKWAREVDVVSNDHYITSTNPTAQVELAMSADLARGLAAGRPWLLMEHSTSAVNWQPINRAKRGGEMIRHSMQHVSRGSEGAMFFQWRQSQGGAEKFHSAMVPHAGEDSQVWRNVLALGAQLAGAAEVTTSTVAAEAAIIYDWECAWLTQNEATPSRLVRYRSEVESMYAALWRGGVTVDFVEPGADLSGYQLVLAPCLHSVSAETVAVIEQFVADGGTFVTTYFSGVVDREDRVILGGYPGAFRAVLGLRVEEFFPLLEGESVTLTDGSTTQVWSESAPSEGAEVLAEFADGPTAGSPAITRHRFGDGQAWYVATRLPAERLDGSVNTMCDDAGLGWRPIDGVERVTRVKGDDRYTFVINHSDSPCPTGVAGENLVEHRPVEPGDQLAAGAVAIVRERGGD